MKNCECEIHLRNDAETHRDNKDYKPEPCEGHGEDCPCSLLKKDK